MLFPAIAAVLLFATQPIDPAAPAASTAAATAVQHEKAQRLANLTNPVERIAEAELREFDEHFVPLLRADEDVAALEQEYPGAVDAIYKASRELVLPQMHKDISQLQEQIAHLFATRFSVSELDELIAFYSSPTGRKLVRGLLENQDARGITEQYLNEGKFSAEKIGEAKADAVATVVKGFTPADEQAMLAVMKLSAFPKLAAMRSELDQIIEAWMNRPTPDFDRQLEEVMSKALEAHIASFSSN